MCRRRGPPDLRGRTTQSRRADQAASLTVARRRPWLRAIVVVPAPRDRVSFLSFGGETRSNECRGTASGSDFARSVRLVVVSCVVQAGLGGAPGDRHVARPRRWPVAV